MEEKDLQKARQLLAKYRLGQCSEEEAAWVEQWYAELGRREPALTDEQLHTDLADLQERLVRIPFPTRPAKIRYLPLAAASILLLVVAGFAWYHFQPDKKASTVEVTAAEVPPGSDRATLVLADGSRIDLASAPAGRLTTFAAKDTANTLLYTAGSAAGSEAHSAINTLVTPNGGQYRLRLPDGSQVVLNAASSLSFPAAFAKGAERKVVLKGEAWFEITADPSAPFVVQTQKQVVQVLGTRFNVNAYPNERQVVTTLEQGSVAVSAATTRQVLRPGQQAILAASKLKVLRADLETALAWKNEQIRFKDATLESVLRQVARWYDIEIEYQGPVSGELFTGGVSRTSSLDAVLRILEISGVKFRLESAGARKRLIVLP